MRILIGAALGLVALSYVTFLNPVHPPALAASLSAPSAEAQATAAAAQIFDSTNPMTPVEEIIYCTDLDRPGVKIGRFCRALEAVEANLRGTPAPPMRALRLLPNLSQIDAIGVTWTSLAPLSQLGPLTSLMLMDAKIADPSALRGFDALEKLSLANSNITDLSLIANATAMRHLSLSNLAIEDLSALQGMTGLRQLHLDGTAVTDLSPLAGMTGLRILDLRNTPVRDVSVLDGLDGLTIYQ